MLRPVKRGCSGVRISLCLSVSGTNRPFPLTGQLVYMVAGTADQDATQEAIMDATYQALCKHGYTDLTIQKIADEFGKSKSLLYYHHDTKDEILIVLLEYLLNQFTVEDTIDPTDDPKHNFSRSSTI